MPDQSTETPEADVKSEDQEKGKSTEGQVTLTQEALNSMNADARRKGQEQGKKQFMESLGLTELGVSEAEIGELLKTAVSSREADKTELERVQAENAKLSGQLADLKSAGDSALAKAQTLLRQAAIMQAASGLKDYEVLPEAKADLWLYVQTDPELLESLQIDDKDQVTGAEAAVLKIIANRPHLAKKISKQGSGTDTNPASKKPGKTDLTPPAAEAPGRPLVKF